MHPACKPGNERFSRAPQRLTEEPQQEQINRSMWDALRRGETQTLLTLEQKGRHARREEE